MNNGPREFDFDLFNGRDGSERNGISFVKLICNGRVLFLLMVSFDAKASV